MVYRLYHPKTGEHLYTTDENEKNVLKSKHGWNWEGVGWFAPKQGQSVYRLYQPKTGEHLYTTDANERKVLTSKHGWRAEGEAWKSGGDVSVKRVYNAKVRPIASHHYTLDENEVKVLTSKHGWRAEGEAWKAVRAGYGVKDGWLKSSSGKMQYWIDDVLQKGPKWLVINRVPYAASDSGLQRYRIDAAGNLVTGYFKVGSNNYYGIPSKGHVLRNAWHDSADLKGVFYANNDGVMGRVCSRCSSDTDLNVRIAKIIKQKNWSGSSGLRKAFNYVAGFRYISGSKFPSGDWAPRFAKQMLNNNGGNCYRFAALYCMFAKALCYNAWVVSGYVPARAGGLAPHGWVQIKRGGTTYICDPDLAHALPGYNWYMNTWSSAPVTYTY